MTTMRALALVAILCLHCVSVMAANMVMNGGFENVDDKGMPENWAAREWTVKTAGEVTTQRGGASGTRALSIALKAGKAVFGCFSRAVDVSEVKSRRMLMSCSYRTVGDTYAQAMVVFFDQDFMEAQWETRPLEERARQLRASPQWRQSTWNVEVPPGARQAVVTFQVLEAGQLLVDDVVLRPVPDEVKWGDLDIGRVAALPSSRRATLRLFNRAPGVAKVTLTLTPMRAGRPAGRVVRNFDIENGITQDVDLRYVMPADEAHIAELQLTDAKTSELIAYENVQVPGLIDAELIRPAFRGTVTDTQAVPQVVAKGSLFGLPAVLGQATLSARLLGTGAEATEDKGIARLEDGSFEAVLPTEGMLIGEHQLRIEAYSGKRCIASLSLPIRRTKAFETQVSHDSQCRLQINGKPVFPIGIYYVMTTEELDKVSAAGFSLAVIPSPKASYILSESAAAKGLGLIVASPSTRKDFWSRRQDKFGNTPSLVGWETLQRPDAKLIHPDIMLGLYQIISEVSPNHPIMTALRYPEMMDDYARATDIIVPWSLPVPRTPITRVAEMVESARAATGGKKPVWALIQAVGKAWGEDSGLDEKTDGRLPTPDEMRAMAYLALVHGADGLLFYAYNLIQSESQRHYDITRDAPELWQALTELVGELNKVTPIIQGGQKRALLSPVADEPVHIARWSGGETECIIAINTTELSTVNSFKIPGSNATELSVMFENRKVTSQTPGAFCDAFRPYSVHIYTTK